MTSIEDWADRKKEGRKGGQRASSSSTFLSFISNRKGKSPLKKRRCVCVWKRKSLPRPPPRPLSACLCTGHKEGGGGTRFCLLLLSLLPVVFFLRTERPPEQTTHHLSPSVVACKLFFLLLLRRKWNGKRRRRIGERGDGTGGGDPKAEEERSETKGKKGAEVVSRRFALNPSGVRSVVLRWKEREKRTLESISCNCWRSET